MRRLLIIALLAAAALPAHAQVASEDQNRIVGEIASCLLAGLPPDWREAEMVVELKEAGAETGDVRFNMRRRLSGGHYEPFRPCDEKKAARSLLEVRKLQAADKRNWTTARLVIRDDETFDLTFDYPK
jgi:hypothetical protein